VNRDRIERARTQRELLRAYTEFLGVQIDPAEVEQGGAAFRRRRTEIREAFPVHRPNASASSGGRSPRSLRERRRRRGSSVMLGNGRRATLRQRRRWQGSSPWVRLVIPLILGLALGLARSEKKTSVPRPEPIEIPAPPPLDLTTGFDLDPWSTSEEGRPLPETASEVRRRIANQSGDDDLEASREERRRRDFAKIRALILKMERERARRPAGGGLEEDR